MPQDPDLLIGLSDGELDALSDSLLAPAAQSRLNELLVRNQDQQLTASEAAELERLLERVDQLTLLKTRAKYTLAQRVGATRP